MSTGLAGNGIILNSGSTEKGESMDSNKTQQYLTVGVGIFLALMGAVFHFDLKAQVCNTAGAPAVAQVAPAPAK